MSIADKLTYLNETKRQLREAINAAFDAGLTEADTFRSYVYALPFWPGRLFLDGEQGAWYDPSDLSTLFQDAAGTTPVTADGDPVGLMLDLSQKLELGPDRIVGFNPFDTDQWVKQGESGPDIRVTNEGVAVGRLSGQTSAVGIYQDVPAQVGDWVVVEGRMRILQGTSSSGFNGVWISGAPSLSIGRQVKSLENVVGWQDVFVVARASSTVTRIYLTPQTNGLEIEFSNISVRELPGNHASQDVAASRPVYRTDGMLHWLEFDGADDRLSFDPVNAETIFFSCETASDTLGVLGGGGNAGETGYAAVGPSVVRYRSSSTALHNLPSQTAGIKVLTIHNSSEGLTRVWGNGQKSADELQKTRISSIRYISPGNVGYYPGEFYGAILHTQDVVNHREGVEMYLANKSGVTLL